MTDQNAPQWSADNQLPTPPLPEAPAAGVSPYGAEIVPTQPPVAPALNPTAGSPYGAAPQGAPYGQQPSYPQPTYQQDPYGTPHPTANVPGYGANPGYAYGAPGYPQTPIGPAGYPMPTQQEVSDVTLNLWLSVFFGWVVALIFYVAKRDTATPLARKAHADNLNFQIIAVIITTAAALLSILILPLLALPLPFIFGIIHACTVPNQLRAGQPGRFIWTPSWVK